jgi:hypothetical protein
MFIAGFPGRARCMSCKMTLPELEVPTLLEPVGESALCQEGGPVSPRFVEQPVTVHCNVPERWGHLVEGEALAGEAATGCGSPEAQRATERTPRPVYPAEWKLKLLGQSQLPPLASRQTPPPHPRPVRLALQRLPDHPLQGSRRGPAPIFSGLLQPEHLLPYRLL